jgi:hypothetical protein
VDALIILKAVAKYLLTFFDFLSNAHCAVSTTLAVKPMHNKLCLRKSRLLVTSLTLEDDALGAPVVGAPELELAATTPPLLNVRRQPLLSSTYTLAPRYRLS